MPPRCLCCDKPLSPVAQHGGMCYGCLDAIVGELLALVLVMLAGPLIKLP
jgi:hypothetical protein